MSLSEKSDPERVHGCIDARADILRSPQGFLPATRACAAQKPNSRSAQRPTSPFVWASAMKITRIRLFKTDLPYVDGAYVWGAGNTIAVAKASVVVIDTDAGLQGCGEFTPCGENYMIAHSEGVEALARLVAPHLLGEDPRQVAHIEHLMDALVRVTVMPRPRLTPPVGISWGRPPANRCGC